MKNEKKQEFASRVAGANRTELIVIMYDIMLENIRESKAAIDSEDIKALRAEIKLAREVLNQLMKSLDFHYTLSPILMNLYVSMDKRLAAVPGDRNPEELREVEEVVMQLRSDFHEISKQDYSEPVMQNTEVIYSGLTYGKGSLNESVDSGSKKRGFTV
ncbi:MAG: flagellar protein FliS [Lachnoclostridium sp.]|jgi:flagellar protein FliS|nr:flagellar protein FliS [Lachnoclostridium sp.]